MYSKMQSILCELDLVPTKLNRLISTGIKRVTSGSLTQFPVKNRVSEPPISLLVILNQVWNFETFLRAFLLIVQTKRQEENRFTEERF